MTKSHDANIGRKLERLADELAKDVDKMSDEDVLKETKENFGDLDSSIQYMERLIKRATRKFIK